MRNGKANPKEYMNSKNPPVNKFWLLPAKIKIEDKIGPIQGVQASAIPIPKIKDCKYLLDFLAISNFFS